MRRGEAGGELADGGHARRPIHNGGCTVHFYALCGVARAPPHARHQGVRPAATMVSPMLSLYRRHRPRSFDQVVGQEHIVRTLRNAIELEKVHHAYLFVGSRGTGKTSMAKLLACAMNAEGGPNANCSPDDPRAKAIMGGQSLDVVRWTRRPTTPSTTSASCARTWRCRR